MEVLSEHLCQGWLEGYLLTGRHGLFGCYEAFIHVIDSMFNQHAKWLKMTREIPWRRPIASLNYLLTSHVWRQDHNGFSHQDPGFIDHVVNKKAEVIRVYLPPDANTLLSVTDHCLRSRDYVNVIVAGKQPALTYLSMDEAVRHCTRGLGIWDWASSGDGEPDVVLACVRGHPDPRDARRRRPSCASTSPTCGVRVVNVVDLMRLQPTTASIRTDSPRREFDALFTDGPADHLRLPRLSVAHPPPDLPTDQPPQPPRPRLQGGGHRHDAVRHGHAQRPRPVPPGDGCHRPRAGPRRAGRRRFASTSSTSGHARRPTPASTARTRPTSATGPGRPERVHARPGARPQRRVGDPEGRGPGPAGHDRPIRAHGGLGGRRDTTTTATRPSSAWSRRSKRMVCRSTRSPRSATGSSTGVSGSHRPCSLTIRPSTRSRRWPTSLRSTTRSRSRRSGPPVDGSRRCRTSRRSTRPSTRRSRSRPVATPCPTTGSRRTGSGDTDSTACRSTGRSGGPPTASLARPSISA